MGNICASKEGLTMAVEELEVGMERSGESMQILIEHVFNKVDKGGPGSDDLTKKIFEQCGLHNVPDARILDIGSGMGASVKVLAKSYDNIKSILATDVIEPCIESINGLGYKNVEAKLFSMTDDPTKLIDYEVDCVWGEGSFSYGGGFTNVAKNLATVLKKGGYCCASHLCFIENDRSKHPKEFSDFWNRAVPDLNTLDEFREILEKGLGDIYEIVDHYIFPPKTWEDFYQPVEKRIEALDEKLKQSKGVQGLIYEIALFRKYKDYYSNVFFILKKK